MTRVDLPQNGPERPQSLWLPLSALGLILLGWVLGIVLTGWGSILFAGLVIAAIVLAAFGLKSPRKALPIAALTLGGLSLLCYGGVFLVTAGADLLSGKPNLLTPRPKVEWDTSHTAVVVRATRPIRHYQPSLSSDYTRNYIPDGQVFGDGRIVWTVYSPEGSRTVMEGRLTPDQMRALLQGFVDAGFFGWKARYASLMPYDNPSSDTLQVNLLSVQKPVTVAMVEPPAGFTDLFDRVATGAGAAEAVFEPAEATLIAVPSGEDAVYDWDAEGLTVDLFTAADGITVQGRILQVAWRVVNENPYFPPPVKMNGATYKIYVIVPGLMK
jgi:hypothetical protein